MPVGNDDSLLHEDGGLPANLHPHEEVNHHFQAYTDANVPARLHLCSVFLVPQKYIVHNYIPISNLIVINLNNSLKICHRF